MLPIYKLKLGAGFYEPSSGLLKVWVRRSEAAFAPPAEAGEDESAAERNAEGGMIRLQTLVELKFLNSSFSSSNFSIRAIRAYHLIETRQTVPCRAIRGDGISVSSSLPPPS